MNPIRIAAIADAFSVCPSPAGKEALAEYRACIRWHRVPSEAVTTTIDSYCKDRAAELWHNLLSPYAVVSGR